MLLDTINTVGNNIQALLSRVFNKFIIEHCFAGPDSMYGVHLGNKEPENDRDWNKPIANFTLVFP